MIQNDLVPTQEISEQLPLFEIVYEHDNLLEAYAGSDWYAFLKDFDWISYRCFAADYYRALYKFNMEAAQERKNQAIASPNPTVETAKEAQLRLLFERPTIDESKPKLFTPSVTIDVTHATITINEESVSPGEVPFRSGGKKPKCFFALLKSFLGTTVMGRPAEPKEVYHNLVNNPTFSRNCGFTIPRLHEQYSSSHIPSLRKLEQFDQIMTEAGLWDKIKQHEIQTNLENGVISKEDILVHDTTHYHGFSNFVTVKTTDEQGKPIKKSQSKVTKRCTCSNKETCSHEWYLVDDGCGTVVKSNGKMHWAHKAAVFSLPQQGVPLDVVAVSDAATNDGKTLLEHTDRIFTLYPHLYKWIDFILADAAYDTSDNRKKLLEEYGIILRASLNPRRKKSIESDYLPKGMEKLTPFGNLLCNAGFEMNYEGVRFSEKQFIYKAPKDDNGVSVCNGCPMKQECSPHSLKGRNVLIDFDLLPGIWPFDPPMAKRFKAMMQFRPSVERTISILKCQLGDDRLSKRSNASFQAYLDKTLIVFHQLLR
jgi:hypothetical protein